MNFLAARGPRKPRCSRPASSRRSYLSSSTPPVANIADNAPRLIFGLGNPGDGFLSTRHNVGFLYIDQLAKRYNVSLQKQKFDSIFGSTEIGGKPVFLIKPQTFMNRSGASVKQWVDFYKISLANSLITYDAADLPVGGIRLRPNGKSGGQKGLESIIALLNSSNIPRLKIGIGRPVGKVPMAAHVLSRWQAEEEALVAKAVDEAVHCTQVWLTQGLDVAMNSFNGTPQPSKAQQAPPKPPRTPHATG